MLWNWPPAETYVPGKNRRTLLSKWPRKTWVLVAAAVTADTRRVPVDMDTITVDTTPVSLCPLQLSQPLTMKGFISGSWSNREGKLGKLQLSSAISSAGPARTVILRCTLRPIETDYRLISACCSKINKPSFPMRMIYHLIPKLRWRSPNSTTWTQGTISS